MYLQYITVPYKINEEKIGYSPWRILTAKKNQNTIQLPYTGGDSRLYFRHKVALGEIKIHCYTKKNFVMSFSRKFIFEFHENIANENF